MFISKKVKHYSLSIANNEDFFTTVHKDGIRAIANFLKVADKRNKNAYISLGTENVFDQKQGIDLIDQL